MTRKPANLSAWVFGLSLLVGVILFATHLSDAQTFLHLLRSVEPIWFAVAVTLQCSTYYVAGEVIHQAMKSGGHSLSRHRAAGLALAKLFVDQTLPSGGLSGTYLIARNLRQLKLPTSLISAALVIDITGFYIAYVICLSCSMAVFSVIHALPLPWLLLVLLFGAIVLTLALTLWRMASHPTADPPRIFHIKRLQELFHFIQQSDVTVARNLRVVSKAITLHLMVFLVDSTTLWTLTAALGHPAPWPSVFVSFMLSSLARTIGIIPGGIGTFEAASVFTLHLMNIPVSVGLSATLLFRGLSFWLPMLPGMWLSRRLMKNTSSVKVTALEAPWSFSSSDLLKKLESSLDGLSSYAAEMRLKTFGLNSWEPKTKDSRLALLWNQVRNPLLMLLIFAAVLSALTEQMTDSLIVTAIVVVSVAFGYSREKSAQVALKALREKVATQATVVRQSTPVRVLASQLVPGDIILLGAGNVVPADAVLLEATHLQINEAPLTGESFPVEKTPGTLAADTSLQDRTNCLYLGTHVQSGNAKAIVVATGVQTEFGKIAQRLTLRPPMTEFDRGVRRFGFLLTYAMVFMVLLVFAAHMWAGRPAIETFLFAVALAVGLSPELLPAILTENLSRSATAMAEQGVLVRHLNAIENLGSMNILCTDKTGTLTEGVVQLDGAWNGHGEATDDILRLAYVNAALEQGTDNPLDVALKSAMKAPTELGKKLGSLPFDAIRRRASVLVEENSKRVLICKGAFASVMEVSSIDEKGAPLDEHQRARLTSQFEMWSQQGLRVLAVATRELTPDESLSRDSEKHLIFQGFLTFLDRPKPGAKEAIAELAQRGVQVKVISGDNALVTAHVAQLVGLESASMLTGKQLHNMTNEALWQAAENTTLFVEVDPAQKERILLSLKKKGHVVGFLGDGVNDAPAMHAADTSLSVEHAVDVARAAADFVLTDRHLDVIKRGIDEGRKTFANTLKYILTTTSANLGNMVSMAVASLFLPFLPLSAGQILLNNFVSDVPAVGIAEDSVDEEMIEKPRRWDMRFIGRFMVEFGVLSSAFDFLTFGVLLFVFHASTATFQTAWFIESLLTELVVALVVRTRRRFFQSRPGAVLLGSTLVLIPLALMTPYLPKMDALGFVPLPVPLLLALMGITVAYMLCAEALKAWFYRVRIPVS